MGKKPLKKSNVAMKKNIRKPFRSFGCPVIFATWPTGKNCLVVTGTMEFWMTFHIFFESGIIIPTDELIFFRGVWNHQPDSEGYEPGQITVDLNPSSAGQPLARPNTCLGIRWQRWWIRPVAVADEKMLVPSRRVAHVRSFTCLITHIYIIHIYTIYIIIYI